MADHILQELSKQTINISKFEEPTITWHESYLTVLTEKGLHFFEFSHNLKCWDKKIDFIQSFISHPKSSPATSLFTDKVINKSLKNMHQTEMIVDHTLWPHNPQLLLEMTSIVDFKWSPVGAINNHDTAIAVLTNVGVVEIYIQKLFKWQCAFQISTTLSEQLEFHLIKPKTFDVLRETTHMLATSAICWSPVLNHDNSCYFITAQKNSKIIFWMIEYKERKTSAKIVMSIQIETCEISSIKWIPISDENFLLVCSNVIGQIIVLNCKHYEGIVMQESCTVWSHKDRMIAKLMEYVEIDDNILLICNKHRHLLVLMIDKKCNVLGHYVKNINDYRITSISKTNNEIYVTTVNCKMYTLNRTMVENELDISLTLIVHQGLSSTHELYGISYSPNQTLCAVCVSDRKISCRKDSLKIEIILMSTKHSLDSLLNLLLINQTKQLTNYWDVIEVMRYKCMKTKEPSSINYEQLYEMACSDVYILKVYLILCYLCDRLKKTFKIGPDFYLPEENIDTVKEEILVVQADKVIHKYYEIYQKDGKLDKLQEEYFIGAKKFLEYFFQKNKRNLYEVLDRNVLSIIDSNTSFVCQCCDEQVTGFKCKNDHLNMFCALTFTPIDSDCYLICKWCNLTAREELFLESPLCLFCDVNLNFVDD